MKLALLVFMLILMSGCDKAFLGDEKGMISLEENLEDPIRFNDGILTSTLIAENIKEEKIHSLISGLHDSQPGKGIRSLLIARNNKLVIESYFNGWSRNRKQDIRSATKSVTSALMGIAIDKRFVSGVDEPVFNYFEDYKSFENWEDKKLEIKIEDFLRMRTGLACNDWDGNSPGNEENMYKTDDWVKFVLDLPTLGSGGDFFSYCTGAPVTLGGIIANSSNLSINEFAEQNLFEPMGIADYTWEIMPNGKIDTGGHLHLRPRDMLKFGLLFLNEGKWNDEQLISQDWVLNSTAPTADVGLVNLQYAYLWWNKTFIIDGNETQTFFAWGNGGQHIFVIPSLEAVVVFTGGNYNSNQWINTILGEMEHRILPSFN